ncbi:uncharacterized protein LOC124186792 isoform X1 [Neodiprion fabricii]|uniref:uncharacterized protein LOC124186792 isoform X1 n=1 Tax=Neodiprion fabricii TaxID=2872261 RepID=UPI001ED9717B|nr:uncharacterized protein LOC124186792 isoform X1 [Neodiprion fabricii]
MYQKARETLSRDEVQTDASRIKHPADCERIVVKLRAIIHACRASPRCTQCGRRECIALSCRETVKKMCCANRLLSVCQPFLLYIKGHHEARDKKLAGRSTSHIQAMRLAGTAASIAILAILASASAQRSNSTLNELEDDAEKIKPPGHDYGSSTLKTEGSLCHHKDYRSYIKCLLRHRRYDSPQATVEILYPGRTPSVPAAGNGCMEECEREPCRRQDVTSCSEVCYDRCLRKTKEIHHRITEYESACEEGDKCEGGKFEHPQGVNPFANLTTSIDIRNYVNNTNLIVNNPLPDSDAGHRGKKPYDTNRNNTSCGPGQPGCSDTGTDIVSGEQPGLNTPLEAAPGFQPWYPAPGTASLALVPQIQMVPQITFGLGISTGFGLGSAPAGCPYTSIWMCIPNQQLQQTSDCSGCKQPYPYQRGRCDPACQRG